MKKIYSIVLMAAALLIGTNVWATTQADIQNAINNAAAGATVNITLNSNVDVASPIQLYAQKDETGKTVNLNLAGFTISNSGSPKALIELFKGTLNITGPGRIVSTANAEAIKVYGYCQDVADWSILNIGEGVSVESTNGTSTASLAANAISVLELRAKYCTYINKDYAGQDLSDAYGFNSIDPTTYKTVYYVYKDTEGQARQSASVTNGHTLVDGGTIDYSSSIYKAGTTVYSLKDSQGRGPYEYVKLSAACAAFGVKINVLPGAFVYGDKYGIKINGTIAVNGANIPTVHIANGAEVKAAAEETKATAVYSSGYGQFIIDGYVHGSTGVYVKSGSVVVNDGAKIQSDNNTGNGINSTGASSGINAGGNAISIEGDNAAYSSNGISLEINGGTIIAGEGGYAVEHENNDGTPANPNSIEINGGTFTGGASGGVSIDNAGGKVVTVDLEGGTFTGDIETLIAAAGSSNIIQQVVAQEGGQATVVIGTKEDGDEISQPTTPSEKQDFVFVNDMSNDIVKLDATTANIAKTLPVGVTEVKYLSLTGTGAYTTTVTVETGKILKVGQVVMNANGKIIVEKGATLIVTGANGIFADDLNNLVLEAEEGNPSIFLLNPDVANNKNPKATIEFISKSFTKSSSDYAFQRFGIPTNGELTSITAKYSGTEVATAFMAFDYQGNAWTNIGYIHASGKPALDMTKLSNAFDYYQMQHNTPNMGTVVTMQGALVGNVSPQLNVRGNFWNGYANSFMAPINAEQLIQLIPNTVQKAFYLYDVTQVQATWEPVSLLDLTDIQPLQPFLIRNSKTAADVEINYAQAVYNPAMGIVPNPAPARANNITKAKMIVKGEDCIDRVTVAEDEKFSAEFDNGYDAAKYMNDGINMYVSADEKMSIFATDDLNNTYVGFQTVNGGNYTIEFAKVEGEDLTLIDHETGAQVAMVEGNVYEFTAAANTTNDYRFEIVSANKVATAIDNVEATKSVKGIYTITGQYVGEMNVWNSLPAGIYVVDGAKRVK